jgi:hypothetical protein
VPVIKPSVLRCKVEPAAGVCQPSTPDANRVRPIQTGLARSANQTVCHGT